MRRWEKKVLRTIRSEAANSLQTPDASLGRENTSDSSVATIATNATWRRKPNAARALLELSAEHVRDGQSPPPGSSTGKQPSDWAGKGGAVAMTTFAEGERTKVGREGSAVDAGQLPKPPPTASGESGNRQTSQELGRPPGQSGDFVLDGGQDGVGLYSAKERVMVGVRDEGENAVANENRDEDHTGHDKQEDGDLKNMVERLLQTSSSLALAVARPLSIKPPPILEVEKDPHQVRASVFQQLLFR